MIKAILITAAAIVAVPLVVAAFRADTFQVQRSLVIAAPPAALQPLISDMRAFNTWNPFNLKDPQIRGEYRGPPAGPGAQYLFAGNKDVGRGSVTVVDATPSSVTMTLEMIEPIAARNTVEFRLVPQGAGTHVTWAMHGKQPYLGRLVGLVFDMDRMVGSEFEKGLALLRQRAEKSA